jgi:hypothetical protein
MREQRGVSVNIRTGRGSGIAVRVGLAAVALLCSAPEAARADKCSEQQAEQQGQPKKNYRTVIGPDGRKIFVIEKAFVVCGKVPKPSVVYAIQASTINYEWENLKQDFLPKVIDSVKGNPF